jgi:hypothetical protein
MVKTRMAKKPRCKEWCLTCVRLEASERVFDRLIVECFGTKQAAPLSSYKPECYMDEKEKQEIEERIKARYAAVALSLKHHWKVTVYSDLPIGDGEMVFESRDEAYAMARAILAKCPDSLRYLDVCELMPAANGENYYTIEVQEILIDNLKE